MEAPVRIENRSQLIYLLTEAAELEHDIMCCYLFAQFSLKSDTSEGVTDKQLSSIRRWRRLLRQVSVEEMLHLASACNLLTAIGGAPQLRRPNLPAHPRAYGATFELRLEPLTIETLEQFIAVEKPMNLYETQSGITRPLPPPLQHRLSDIFSSERDYDTQGHLYRGIEDGVQYLAQKYGERELFISPTNAQTGGEHFPHLPGLAPVTNLSSALSAIKVIVEQGEGARIDSPDSHYSKFMTIWREYKEMLEEDPNFQPARPVLSNPYAIAPTDMTSLSEINLLDDETTADISNFFDGCYELMVQMLGRLFMHGDESSEQLVRLAQIAEGMMIDVISPMGSALTRLPAGPSFPGRTAGPSFRLSRGAVIPTQGEAAWFVFRERLLELSAYCRLLQTNPGSPPILARVREGLVNYAELLKERA